MATTDDEWSISANDVVRLSQVRANNDDIETVEEFAPTFTYPIFGEAEQIFGYKGLEIDLQFAAHDGTPHVQISYEKKFPAVKSTQALDLNTTLQEFLPPSAFEDDYNGRLLSDKDTKEWHPPGKLVHKYSKKGNNFEIWAGSLLDPKVNQLVRNVQVLVLFYIEAGSLLNLDEVDWSLDRWRVYFVFQKDLSNNGPACAYTLLGYSTTYRFWTFAKGTQTSGLLKDFPSEVSLSHNKLNSRLRISQFLLLPPYQKAGHGSQLYQAIYNEIIPDSTISELTVEDPSEEFDQLRDSCDWKILEPQFRSANIAIDVEKPLNDTRISKVPNSTVLPLEKLNNIRIRNKIAPRQFARLTELYLLSLIPFSHRSTGGASLTKLKIQKHKNKNPNDRRYYWWRILMKQRIYKKNKEGLRQVDFEERYNAIEDSARGQEDEYEGLLMLFALRQASADRVSGDGNVKTSSSRKRKVIDDDEDDEDEEVEEVEVSIPKRARK